MKFDELIINYLGEFGTYQKIKFFLVCLPTILTAMHALSWTFTAAIVDHRCRLPNEPANSEYWLSNASPFIEQSQCNLKEHPTWQRCPYKECQYGNLTYCPHGYVYDHSVVTLSAIEKWDIVCDMHILKAVIQSMYYIGQMIGSLIFGFLGDRIGRKKVFFIAIILQIVAGAGMVVAPHWIAYSILRMMVGFAHPGIFVIAVVIGMELVGPSKRKIAAVFTGMFFSIGQTLLGVLAYYLRDYQHLQAAIALPALMIIPESARWLVSQKRFAEADAILQRVARANKTQLPNNWWEQIDEQSEKKDGSLTEEIKTSTSKETDTTKVVRRKHNFLDLFRTPKIRCIALTPVVSMVYYGISMNPNFLGGSMYMNFIFGGLMEIPAVTIVYLLVDKIGRKPLLAGGYIISSICALSMHWLISILQYLIAKAAITTTYATIYTFTPELFPTVIRNTAMGVCSMMARVGAILASFISMWLVEIAGKAAMVIPFSTLGLLAAILALIFLPETKGITLPETIEQSEGTVQAHELVPLSGEAQNSSKTENKTDE